MCVRDGRVFNGSSRGALRRQIRRRAGFESRNGVGEPTLIDRDVRQTRRRTRRAQRRHRGHLLVCGDGLG